MPDKKNTDDTIVESEVEIEARDVEDAIAEGLARLSISRADADIEILEEGGGGFLGFGGKRAKVRVRKLRRAYDCLKDIISNLLTPLDPTADLVKVEVREGRWFGELSANELALVLGRRGRTLDAIQVLASALASRRTGKRVRLTLDLAGFRERRKDELSKMAVSLAKEVLRDSVELHLDPMSSHDRKVIHSSLSSMKEVKTESEGSGERRHIVIKPKNAGANTKKRNVGRGSSSNRRDGRRSGGRSGGQRSGGARSGSRSGSRSRSQLTRDESSDKA